MLCGAVQVSSVLCSPWCCTLCTLYCAALCCAVQEGDWVQDSVISLMHDFDDDAMKKLRCALQCELRYDTRKDLVPFAIHTALSTANHTLIATLPHPSLPFPSSTPCSTTRWSVK